MAVRVVLLVLLATGFPTAIAGSGMCSQSEIELGFCSIDANLNNGSANLGGNVSPPGGSDTSYSGGASAPDDPLADCVYILSDRCVANGPGRSTPAQPVTLADIASFTPNAAVHAMEPDGWAVIGLATNFYATAGAQVHEGTLLGQPASVRFTPVAWHWDYGDGTSATLGTGGASWGSLGIPEFDATPTSHSFRTAGNFTIRLTIEYSAEYRVGPIPWTPIAGTLPVAAPPLAVTAGDARTVLVARDCAMNPAGPGC